MDIEVLEINIENMIHKIRGKKVILDSETSATKLQDNNTLRY